MELDFSNLVLLAAKVVPTNELGAMKDFEFVSM